MSIPYFKNKNKNKAVVKQKINKLLKNHKSKYITRYIKFLSSCVNPSLWQSAIKASPVCVIKGISNAALNAQHGQVKLTPRHKKLFSANNKIFATLTNKSIPIVNKRKVLSQKGGFGIIPSLLAVVLASLGTSFISRE